MLAWAIRDLAMGWWWIVHAIIFHMGSLQYFPLIFMGITIYCVVQRLGPWFEPFHNENSHLPLRLLRVLFWISYILIIASVKLLFREFIAGEIVYVKWGRSKSGWWIIYTDIVLLLSHRGYLNGRSSRLPYTCVCRQPSRPLPKIPIKVLDKLNLEN